MYNPNYINKDKTINARTGLLNLGTNNSNYNVIFLHGQTKQSKVVTTHKK